MRSLLFGLLSIFTVNQVFAGGSTPPSLRAEGDEYGRKQREAYAKAEALERKNTAEIAEKTGVDIQKLQNQIRDLQSGHSERTKGIDDLQKRLSASRKSRIASFDQYSQSAIKALKDKDGDEAAGNLGKVLGELKEAYQELDLMGDLDQLQAKEGELGAKLNATMDALDSSIMGRYMRQRNLDMFQSQDFCSAVQTAAKATCSNRPKIQDPTKASSTRYLDETPAVGGHNGGAENPTGAGEPGASTLPVPAAAPASPATPPEPSSAKQSQSRRSKDKARRF
jgi:hypothetical protein